MKQRIFTGVLLVFLITSIFANFFPPLFFSSDEIGNINLSLNVKDCTFQPLLITKREGITETLNGRFHLKPNIDDSVVEINKIEFNITKLSGIFNHKIKDVTLDIDKKGNPLIIMDIGVFRGDKLWTFYMDSIKCPKVKKAFEIKTDSINEIYTIAHYGDEKLLEIIKKLREGEISITDEEILLYLDRENGSICNINTIHE